MVLVVCHVGTCMIRAQYRAHAESAGRQRASQQQGAACSQLVLCPRTQVRPFLHFVEQSEGKTGLKGPAASKQAQLIIHVFVVILHSE